VQLYVGLMF